VSPRHARPGQLRGLLEDQHVVRLSGRRGARERSRYVAQLPGQAPSGTSTSSGSRFGKRGEGASRVHRVREARAGLAGCAAAGRCASGRCAIGRRRGRGLAPAVAATADNRHARDQRQQG
jgi:hypothetical protein